MEIYFPVLISQDWVDIPSAFEEHLRFYIYKTPMCGLLFQTGKTLIFIFNVVPSPLGCFYYTLCLLCSLIYKTGINNSMNLMVCDINWGDLCRLLTTTTGIRVYYNLIWRSLLLLFFNYYCLLKSCEICKGREVSLWMS